MTDQRMNRYGRLVVIGAGVPQGARRRPTLECECDCGQRRTPSEQALNRRPRRKAAA